MQSLDHATSLMQLYAIMGDGDDGCRRLRARDWCSASLSPPLPPPWDNRQALLVGFHSGGSPPF